MLKLLNEQTHMMNPARAMLAFSSTYVYIINAAPTVCLS